MEISKDGNESLNDVFADLDLNIDNSKSAEPEVKDVSDIANEVAEEVEKTKKSKEVILKTNDVNNDVTPDTKTLVIQFVTRYLNLLEQKKNIDSDIKALKQEFSELGLAHSVVLKALNSVQKRRKMSYSQRNEFDAIQSILEQSNEVSDALEALEAK